MLELGVLLYQLELLYTHFLIQFERGPPARIFVTFLLFTLGKKLLDQNDEEFD